MPLFNEFLPTSSVALKPRTFEAGWWGDTKRALSGVKADGSSNLFGSIVEKGLPILATAVGTYYGGAVGGALGNAVGNLGVKGQDLWSEKILRGTDAEIQARQTNAREQSNDGLINTLSQVAGTAAGALSSSNALKTGQTKTPSVADKLLGGLVTQVPNVMQQLNGQMPTMQNPANANLFQYNDGLQTTENMGQTSSIIPNTDPNTNIKWLDDKKKPLSSTLPNSMFGTTMGQQSFADGGEAQPRPKPKNFEAWRLQLPLPLQDTTSYNLRGAYEAGLLPEQQSDGTYHMASRNPLTGEILKNPTHPTFKIGLNEDLKLGYMPYQEKSTGKIYTFKERPSSAQFSPYSFTSFADGGESGGDIKIYSEGDNTEDFFMVDKDIATDLGIDKVLNQVSFGQARYGERILDQQSNLFIKDVMNSDLDPISKKAMLGEHLFDEIMTHSDFSTEHNSFANGGETKNPKPKKKPKQLNEVIITGKRDPIFVDNPNDSRLRAYQDSLQAYNTGKSVVGGIEAIYNNYANKYGDTGLSYQRNFSDFYNKANTKPEYGHIEKGRLMKGYGSQIQADWLLNSSSAPAELNYPAIAQQYKRLDRLRVKPQFVVHQAELQDVPIYKKPVQPIVFQPSKTALPSVSIITNSESSAPSLPSIQVPKPREQVPYNKELQSLPSMNIGETTDAYQRRLIILRNANPNTYRTNLNQQKYMDGGEIWEEPLQSFKKGGYITKGSAKKQVKEFQLAYNQWALDWGFPTITPDGLYGPKTSAAVTNWNIKNPQRTVSIDLSGKTLSDLKLNPVAGFSGSKLPIMDAITGYDKKGNPTTADLPSNAPVLTLKPNGLVGDALARVNTETTVRAKNAPTTTPGKETLTPTDRQNLFANLGDLATAGVGALISQNNPIPFYTPPAEYTKMLNETIAKKDQGFSSVERASINQGLQNNFATNVAAIKSITGGGASQGAVLGALGQASNQLDDSLLSTAVADVQQQRSNYANYQKAVTGDLALDQQMFSQQQQAALAQKQSGIDLLDASLQNIADRTQYNQQYGPGTPFDQLQKSQLAGISKYNSLADAYPEIYAQALRDQLAAKSKVTL